MEFLGLAVGMVVLIAVLGLAIAVFAMMLPWAVTFGPLIIGVIGAAITSNHPGLS